MSTMTYDLSMSLDGNVAAANQRFDGGKEESASRVGARPGGHHGTRRVGPSGCPGRGDHLWSGHLRRLDPLLAPDGPTGAA